MAKALPRLQMSNYLRSWDSASSSKRDKMLLEFLDDYGHYNGVSLDLETLLSHGGSLLFSRLVVGMQISVGKRERVGGYFDALRVFVGSLQGEKFILEFVSMGAVRTTFELLRVDEMSSKDKVAVFRFLSTAIDGSTSFVRFKEFISEPTYLSALSDSLLSCRDSNVINSATSFLHLMCEGATDKNIVLLSKLIIAFLPCDFNPLVQSLACSLLPKIIDQHPRIAPQCYSYVVEVLKTDYYDMLVQIGELCLAIMATSIAEDLLRSLIEAALPSNINEQLDWPYPKISTPSAMTRPMSSLSRGAIRDRMSNISSAYSGFSHTTKATAKEDGEERRRANYQAYSRQQSGALFVLSFILKNRPEFANLMVEGGIVGSLLASIGSCPFERVQLAGIRLLLLLNDVSGDSFASLPFLLPPNLLDVILDEGERVLEYLSAPMCLLLRRIGRLVQRHWTEWFEMMVIRGGGGRSWTGSTLQYEEASEDDSNKEFRGAMTSKSGVFENIDGQSSGGSDGVWEDLDKSEFGEEVEEDGPKAQLNLSTNEQIREWVSSLQELFPVGTLPLVETMEGFQIGGDLRREIEGLPVSTSKKDVGVEVIFEDEKLESFRKYLLLHTAVAKPEVDDLESHSESKSLPSLEREVELGGREMVLLEEAQKQLEKMRKPVAGLLHVPESPPGGGGGGIEEKSESVGESTSE